MENKKIALIPAYKPTGKMTEIARQLNLGGFCVVIVNDGSGADFDGIFNQARDFAEVISLNKNSGKGTALKTGLKYVQKRFEPPYTVVTVDADGQHRLKDVVRVCDDAQKHPGCLVLGSRRLDETAPKKSIVGNRITNVLHRITTGLKLIDTQTGLRAFSDKSIEKAAAARGTKYEYEMYALLAFSKPKNIREVEIEVVYEDNNSGSHFRPLKDSLRIYAAFFRYIFSKKS